MKFHPMNINTNTRARWEAMKDLPQLKSLKGKNVLDIGAGLGFFSVRFSEFGARVLAVDVDGKALGYLRDNYGIETECIDVTCDRLPDRRFDLIFIGEILEHIREPFELLRKAREILSPSGVIFVTTPAMEGLLINTKGKRLGHSEGSETHERDGFYMHELEELVSRLRMKTVYHTFTLFTFTELVMQLTKVGYIKQKDSYRGQSDVISVMDSFPYRVLRFIYPLLVFIFNIEQTVSGRLKLKGHCHILIAEKM